MSGEGGFAGAPRHDLRSSRSKEEPARVFPASCGIYSLSITLPVSCSCSRCSFCFFVLAAKLYCNPNRKTDRSVGRAGAGSVAGSGAGSGAVSVLGAQDSFLHWKFAVAPCAVFGFIVHTWDYWRYPKSFFSPVNVSDRFAGADGGGGGAAVIKGTVDPLVHGGRTFLCFCTDLFFCVLASKRRACYLQAHET